MTLKDLLQSKPSKMVTCRITCLVADAVTVMDKQNVGSILVLDENDKLAGIFTERDIMHCFTKGINFSEVTMDRIMTPDPVTLECSAGISTAVKVMSERKIRHLPVMEGERIFGVISYRDLVSNILPEVIYMAEDIY